MGAAVLALCAAALWGTGDFLGGFGSRRMSVLVVLFWSQLAGLVGLLAWLLLSGAALPGIGAVLAAVGAGVAGIVGLGCLYRAMALGAMGIVAPISATGPVIPLVVDIARGRSPGAVQWIGIAVALVGVVLLSREPGEGRMPVLAAGVGLALASSLGFGLFLLGIGFAAQESASWAAVIARATEACLIVAAVAVTRTAVRTSRRLFPLVLAVGVFDAGANAVLALAASRGTIGIVGVLSSLYPVMTIVLAWAVLRERLGPRRLGGGLIAIAGAALIAAG